MGVCGAPAILRLVGWSPTVLPGTYDAVQHRPQQTVLLICLLRCPFSEFCSAASDIADSRHHGSRSILTSSDRARLDLRTVHGTASASLPRRDPICRWSRDFLLTRQCTCIVIRSHTPCVQARAHPGPPARHPQRSVVSSCTQRVQTRPRVTNLGSLPPPWWAASTAEAA